MNIESLWNSRFTHEIEKQLDFNENKCVLNYKQIRGIPIQTERRKPERERDNKRKKLKQQVTTTRRSKQSENVDLIVERS